MESPSPPEPTPAAPPAPPAVRPRRRKGKGKGNKPKVRLVQVEVLEEPSIFDRTLLISLGICLLVMPMCGRVALRAVPQLQEVVDQVVEMEIFEPTPPPEEEPEPEPEPTPPPKPKVVDLEKVKEPIPTATATEEPVEEAKPVFGVSMKSTVDTGAGSFSMKVGNTVMKENDKEDVPPDDVKPLRSVSFQRLETPPRISKDFRADYPEGPRAEGIEGTVIMKLTISETGRVTAVKIVRGVHPELDAAAKKAAFKFVFKPGMSGGEPVITTNYVYRYTWLIDG